MALDYLELELTGGRDRPCRCWDLNPGPLQDHPVSLTAETTLQSFLTRLFIWVLGIELES